MQYPDYILLVDDDPTTNFLNKMVIEKAQIAKKVFCVGNGEDAFSKIYEIEAQKSPGVKRLCIFLDLDMPILDGFEFLKELKLSRVDLKIEVFVLSILSEFREKKKLSPYPIAGFISKPLHPFEVEKLFYSSEPCFFNQSWEQLKESPIKEHIQRIPSDGNSN